jgi:hypothetical protein
MKYVPPLILALTAIVHGQQWQGAKVICKADTMNRPYMTSVMLTSDTADMPWIFWQRFNVDNPDSTMLWEMTHWNGRKWVEPQQLPDTIRQEGSYWDGVFAPDGRLWLVYPMRPLGNYVDIQSVRYDPSTGQWELPTQVNAPDTNSLDDFYPRIDIGGGQVWAVWFNEVGSRAICDIKASHWDEGAHSWGPELTVNPDTSGINRMEWFPDVAVDREGIPHVVWTCSRPSVSTPLLYSRYENGQWTAPESISNQNAGGPYGGTRPRLVDDADGNLHCVFIGAEPGDTVVGLYYCRRSGGIWSKPVRTDTWATTGAPIWDKDLAVASPDNIWVTFDRGDGSDWMVFAQHFDGHLWSPEERIDDGRTFQGGFPKITLDADGRPFVAWSADSSTRTSYAQVWYNRYAVVGLAERQPAVLHGLQPEATVVRGVLFVPPAKGKERMASGDLLDISGRTVLELRSGSNDVSQLAPGVYFVRAEVTGRRSKVILTR